MGEPAVVAIIGLLLSILGLIITFSFKTGKTLASVEMKLAQIEDHPARLLALEVKFTEYRTGAEKQRAEDQADLRDRVTPLFGVPIKRPRH